MFCYENSVLFTWPVQKVCSLESVRHVVTEAHLNCSIFKWKLRKTYPASLFTRIALLWIRKAECFLLELGTMWMVKFSSTITNESECWWSLLFVLLCNKIENNHESQFIQYHPLPLVILFKYFTLVFIACNWSFCNLIQHKEAWCPLNIFQAELLAMNLLGYLLNSICDPVEVQV